MTSFSELGSQSSYAVTKRNANDNLVVQGPFSTSRKLGTRVRMRVDDRECKRNIISAIPRGAYIFLRPFLGGLYSEGLL